MMHSYKDALKTLLEADETTKPKRKSKNAHSVTFKVSSKKKTKQSQKRKNVTPFRRPAVRTSTHSNDTFRKVLDFEESAVDLSPPQNLPKRILDFDDSDDVPTKRCMSNNNVEWITESDCVISPSCSEFYKKNLNDSFVSDTNDTSATFNYIVSEVFDDTSSDSSSSSDNFIDFSYVEENCSDNLDSSLLVDAVDNEAFDAVDEEIDLYDSILCEVPGGCIAILKSNCPLYVHGIFTLSVLYGTVDVFGYTLTTYSTDVEIYSLRGSSYLFLENRNTEYDSACNSSYIEEILISSNIGRDVVRRVVDNWSSSVAIVFCKKFDSQSLQFLEKHVAQQLLPKPNRDLPCTFRIDAPDWNVLTVGDDWEDLTKQINATSKVMLCGGKSVGKSTLLRFMVNRLLMTYAKVLVIDLDPGQPEFTVSGCVSATIITEPVFGPNYTHLSTPERCIFVRNINISYDPSEYIDAVRELLQSCFDLPKKIPTLINYMGYSRSLGLNLVATIISLVSPNLLVQIQSNRRQRNFDEKLTVDVVKEHSKLLNVSSVNGHSLAYDFEELLSMSDDYEGWQMEPRIVRELCVLSYFSRMLGPNNLSITSTQVPIYKINLTNICIVDGENINAPSTVNASLVALCSASKTERIFKCHGWGIVRGVDVESNELFLLTPISAEELENVTHLLLGIVSLPPALFMSEDNKRGIVPYVSVGMIYDFNSIPKRSHLPKGTYSRHD